MKNIDKIKIAVVTVFTALHSWLGVLAVPFYLLVLTNIIDYGTGIYAAVCRGEKVSSDVGFRGIAKKVCMWLLVLLGMIVDFIVVQLGHTVNISFGFDCIVAVAVVFWLLANELICMWLLVLLGMIVDFIVVQLGHTVNISFGFDCIVAVAVVFWLLANELISILENINDIGTPLPPFLRKLVELIKEKTEETVDIDKDNIT